MTIWQKFSWLRTPSDDVFCHENCYHEDCLEQTVLVRLWPCELIEYVAFLFLFLSSFLFCAVLSLCCVFAAMRAAVCWGLESCLALWQLGLSYWLLSDTQDQDGGLSLFDLSTAKLSHSALKHQMRPDFGFWSLVLHLHFSTESFLQGFVCIGVLLHGWQLFVCFLIWFCCLGVLSVILMLKRFSCVECTSLHFCFLG
jgi:hypothetical protein